MAAFLAVAPPQAVRAASSGGAASFDTADLKEWLSYIASDDLQGRAVFSTGLGLASSYLQQHLRQWGVKPGGDNGSYLQTVKVLGVKAARHSTVTVTINGERRTFTDGDAIRFQRNTGARQTVTLDRVEFAGYGLDAPRAGHESYRGRDVSGAAVVWLGAEGPGGPRRPADSIRPRTACSSTAAAGTRSKNCAPPRASASHRPAGRGGQNQAAAAPSPGGRTPIPAADFTTAERLDRIVPPQVTGTDPFFEFLFSRAPVKYSDLKRRAEAREALPGFRLDGVTLTFEVNTDYEVVRTQFTQNVVAIVEGSDPQLKQTYVAFGAHYDHVGYAEGELTNTADGHAAPRLRAASPRVRKPIASGTGPTMTVRGRLRCWRWRAPSRWARGRSDRSCLSGMRARNAAAGDRSISPTMRRSASTASSRS